MFISIYSLRTSTPSKTIKNGMSVCHPGCFWSTNGIIRKERNPETCSVVRNVQNRYSGEYVSMSWISEYVTVTNRLGVCLP